jgi:hypothetical protein
MMENDSVSYLLNINRTVFTMSVFWDSLSICEEDVRSFFRAESIFRSPTPLRIAPRFFHATYATGMSPTPKSAFFL